MSIKGQIERWRQQQLKRFANPKPQPQPTHGTVTGFEQGLIQVSTSEGQQLRQQQGTRAIGVGYQVVAHDNTAVFTGEAGVLPKPGRVFIAAPAVKRALEYYLIFRRNVEYTEPGGGNFVQFSWANFWASKQITQGGFIEVDAKNARIIRSKSTRPIPELTWVESPHPGDGPLKPIFQASPGGYELELTGFEQPATGAQQGLTIQAGVGFGTRTWEGELSATLPEGSNWIFYITGTVEQSGHTAITGDVRNDIYVEMDVRRISTNRITSFYDWDWRVQQAEFVPGVESSVTSADPTTYEFFSTWSRDLDLHQQTLVNGNPSPLWETTDGQNILFQYFGTTSIYRQDVPLQGAFTGPYRVRFSFNGDYQQGAVTFTDFKIHFKVFPNRERYYLGAGRSPYYATLVEDRNSSLAYTEWDNSEATGALSPTTGAIGGTSSEDAERRGNSGGIVPLSYDWRADQELNYDIEIDYEEIEDECLKLLAQNPGANIHNGLVYICDFDQLINGVPLHEAIQGPGVGGPYNGHIPELHPPINAVVEEFTYGPGAGSCTLTPTGKSWTIAIPILSAAGPFSLGSTWYNTSNSYSLIEHELIAIAFKPPS